MALIYDSKENLYLRMEKLRQKLKKSEEERNELEKRYNVLMSTFKEEENINYNALNNKYENFLEDCKFRRRRNDIILKSLCRVEDKAKVLYAKTERLKMLRDRYVTYLKQNNLQSEIGYLPGNVYSTLPPNTEKTLDEIIPKSVHWKTPLIADFILYNKEVSKHDEGLQSNIKPFLKNEGQDKYDSDFPRDKLYKYFTENYGQLGDSLIKSDFDKWDKKEETNIDRLSYEKDQPKNVQFTQDKLRLNQIGIPFSPQLNYLEENRQISKISPVVNIQKNSCNLEYRDGQFGQNTFKTQETSLFDSNMLERLQANQNPSLFGNYKENGNTSESSVIGNTQSLVQNQPAYTDISVHNSFRPIKTNQFLPFVTNKETKSDPPMNFQEDSKVSQYLTQNEPYNTNFRIYNSSESDKTHLNEKYNKSTNDKLGTHFQKENQNLQYSIQNQPIHEQSMIYKSNHSDIVSEPFEKYKIPAGNNSHISFPKESQNLQYSTQNEANTKLYNFRTFDKTAPDLKSFEKSEETTENNFQKMGNSKSDNKETLYNDVAKASFLTQKGVVQHQKSINKLKKALSVEEEFEKNGKESEKVLINNADGKFIEKEDFEMSEKEEHSLKYEVEVYRAPSDSNLNKPVTSTMLTKNKNSIEGKDIKNNEIEFKMISERQKNDEENISYDESVKNNDYPMGLDGVDYQNETYPDSYYEQPERHHNYSNLVSNVILEEDEYELDAEQAEENDQSDVIYQTKTQIEQVFDRNNNSQASNSSSQRGQSPERKNLVSNEPFNKSNKQQQEYERTTEGHFIKGNPLETCNQLKSQESVSDKSVENETDSGSEMQKSAKNQKIDGNNSEVVSKILGNVSHSNLAHLLDSDSESFKIEHADLPSGNDDSDFDFSFQQN